MEDNDLIELDMDSLEDGDGSTVALDRGDELTLDDGPLVVEPAADEPVDEPVADEPAETADEPDADEPVEPESEEPEVDDTDVVESKAPKKKIMIPKSRLDDEIAKRRKLEAQLAQIEKDRDQKATTAQADEAFEAVVSEANGLLRQANEAVLDGDLDKAAQLQQQAMVKMATARQMPAQDMADPDAMAEQIEARIELKATLKDIYRRFPEFDNSSESADADLIERAVMYEKMYADMGHTPATAVERAVEDALRLLRPERLQEPPVKQKADPEKLRTQQKRQDLKQKVDLAAKQPPEPKGSEVGEPVVSLTDLSDEEFDALPASKRAQLRGDFG